MVPVRQAIKIRVIYCRRALSPNVHFFSLNDEATKRHVQLANPVRKALGVLTPPQEPIELRVQEIRHRSRRPPLSWFET